MAQQSVKCHQIEKMEQKDISMFWGKFDILESLDEFTLSEPIMLHPGNLILDVYYIFSYTSFTLFYFMNYIL